MDNFTLAVIIGDALVVVILIALIAFDKGSPAPLAPEPVKPGRK